MQSKDKNEKQNCRFYNTCKPLFIYVTTSYTWTFPEVLKASKKGAVHDSAIACSEKIRHH